MSTCPSQRYVRSSCSGNELQVDPSASTIPLYEQIREGRAEKEGPFRQDIIQRLQKGDGSDETAHVD